VLLRPAAAAGPGNLLEMQILRLHSGHPELEALGKGISNQCFNKSFQGTLTHLLFENLEVISVGLH